MWPETIRVIRIVRPRFCLLENVPGLLSHGYFGTILGDLAESGYDAKWKVLSAAEVGAPHKRDRLWIVCHANNMRLERGDERDEIPSKKPTIQGLSTRGECQWDDLPQPYYIRSSDGVANRVDRLKAIGNGQVPKVVETIWRLLGSD